jgi:hypothetical protein
MFVVGSYDGIACKLVVIYPGFGGEFAFLARLTCVCDDTALAVYRRSLTVVVVGAFW